MKLGELDERADQPEPKTPLGCWIAITLAGVLVLSILRFFHPPDWVDVTVGPFPVGRWEYFLLAEDSGGVEPLAYYETKVFPFTMMPGKDISGMEVSGNQWHTYSYQWRDASRYGVLARGGDGRWLLWWLRPDEVRGPSLLRYIVGGGTADLRIPDESRAEIPTPQFLDRLGLSR